MARTTGFQCIIENNQPRLPWRDCIVELAQKEGINKYRRRDLGFVDATERGLDGNIAKKDVRIW